MAYLETYLEKVEEEMPGGSLAVKTAAEDFSRRYIDQFSFNEHLAGLLFGHVQSGKTRQMLGVAATAADAGFRLFILVTTDNVILHGQTLKRAHDSLGGFIGGFKVIGESGDSELKTTDFSTPVMVVLKKNSRVLRAWANHLSSNAKCRELPLFLLDDEADASSLNTLINSNEQSTMNGLLDTVRKQAPASIYLHVTATPQSLLLQAQDSAWKPSFAHYIKPGESYLGGDFFYGENPISARVTKDNERDELVDSDNIPEGLRKAVLTFLVVSSHILSTKSSTVTNLLIHPGHRVKEHDVVKGKLQRYLAGVKNDLMQNAITVECDLKDSWEDLRSTKPDLVEFDHVLAFIRKGMPDINIMVLNSQTEQNQKFDLGANIIVGGNSLGRGVTFPSLQVVYYCRSSKKPQADTCWQHSRIFGYDRDAGLCRIFSPTPLLKLFHELNDSNNALFARLREKGPHSVSIMTPVGTRPTRMSVVKKAELMTLAGGVNYFPSSPLAKNVAKIDALVAGPEERDISLDEIIAILSLINVEKMDPWYGHNFSACVGALKEKEPKATARLLVRRERSIKRGTGTLLSPDDRERGSSYPDKLVLTMYRLNGEKHKGWDDKPLWVPNLKFAEGNCFYFQP